MKTMKVALLATAALAAVSVSARADDTAAIKAQLEALTARIAQLEASPAAPVGYSLLTISEGTPTEIPGLERTARQIADEGNKVTVIGIMPTADVPASTTIEWSGFVRAAIVYKSFEDDGLDDDIDVPTRAELKVVGRTDTAVGEVGARIVFRAEGEGYGNQNFETPDAWGWWAMTPELTFGGGYTGSLGNIGYGYDGACSCYFTDNADVDLNPGDVTQMRLTWASGPLSMAVAVEDVTADLVTNNAGTDYELTGFGGGGDNLGVAGEVKYAGDTFSGEISGVWHDGGSGIAVGPGFFLDTDTGVITAINATSFNPQDSYQIGAGIGFGLGDMFSISAGAAMGQVVTGEDFWAASILASVNLSDSWNAQIAYGYKDYNDDLDAIGAGANAAQIAAVDAAFFTNQGVLAALYYEPVEQLTIGLEGEWQDPTDDDNDIYTAAFVTVWRF